VLVGVDEPGENGPALEVDDPGVALGEALDLLVGADFEEPAVPDGYCLGDCFLGVYGDYLAVGEYEVGPQVFNYGCHASKFVCVFI